MTIDGEDKYTFVVYEDAPVRTQAKENSNNIAIVFYNKLRKVVSERDWREKSRKVFVPKRCGTRRHVIDNWHKYRLYG